MFSVVVRDLKRYVLYKNGIDLNGGFTLALPHILPAVPYRTRSNYAK